MMFRSLLILLVCAGCSMAQDTASAVKAARELAGAVKTGDTMWMVEKMYPLMKANLVKNAGGEENVKARFRQVGVAMKQAGMVCEEFEVKAPFGEYMVKNGTEKIVVLPTKLVYSIQPAGQKKLRVEQTGFLYAVARKDAPNTWYFIDGKTMNINEMRNLFYDLPVNIQLPETGQRQLP